MAIPVVPLALGFGAGALLSGLFRKSQPQSRYVPTEFEKFYMNLVKDILNRGGLGMPEDLKKRIYGLEAARLRGEAMGLSNVLGAQLGATGTYTGGMPALIARDIGRTTQKKLADLSAKIEQMDWQTRLQSMLAALGQAPRLISGQQRMAFAREQLKQEELEGLKRALSISIPLIISYILNPVLGAGATASATGEIAADFLPYIG